MGRSFHMYPIPEHAPASHPYIPPNSHQHTHTLPNHWQIHPYPPTSDTHGEHSQEVFEMIENPSNQQFEEEKVRSRVILFPPLTTTWSSLIPRPSPSFPSLTAQLSRTVLQVTKSWARAWEPGYTLSTGVDIEGIFIRYEYWLHHCVQNCCFASIKSGSYRGNRYSSIDMCMWAPPLMKFNDTVLRDCFIIWLTNRSYSLVLSASRASKSDVEL